MNTERINDLIHGKIVCKTSEAHEYTCAFTSDLMSDVLALSESKEIILITGLSNVQTIRTAEVANIGCIIIGRGKRITAEMIHLAKEGNIALISSPCTLFEISGRLFEHGIKPIL